MKDSYQFGGEYYCVHCKNAHHFLSKKGRHHIKYAKKEIQKYAFVNFKIY
jgi:hypothetical protein